MGLEKVVFRINGNDNGYSSRLSPFVEVEFRKQGVDIYLNDKLCGLATVRREGEVLVADMDFMDTPEGRHCRLFHELLDFSSSGHAIKKDAGGLVTKCDMKWIYVQVRR